MLTVNKHGGIAYDCIEVFHVRRGTFIYPTVLTGHIGEHHHVALPLPLQKANIYWLVHKHPTVDSLSTLHCNRSGKILLLKNIEVFLLFYVWLQSQNPCSRCPDSEARLNPLLWFCPWATPPKRWRQWRDLGQREELNICPQDNSREIATIIPATNSDKSLAHISQTTCSTKMPATFSVWPANSQHLAR